MSFARPKILAIKMFNRSSTVLPSLDQQSCVGQRNPKMPSSKLCCNISTTPSVQRLWAASKSCSPYVKQTSYDSAQFLELHVAPELFGSSLFKNRKQPGLMSLKLRTRPLTARTCRYLPKLMLKNLNRMKLLSEPGC